jgi:hypothetical protein
LLVTDLCGAPTLAAPPQPRMRTTA